MKKNWRTEIIKLYDEFMAETKEQRTIALTCLDEKDKNYGKQVQTEMKANFADFMEWLRRKNFNN